MSPDRCKAIIYGWYSRGNVGDEMMKAALTRMLVPREASVSFVDAINFDDLSGASVVIFGGGSILHDAPAVSAEALAAMLSGKIPVMYVGVGTETSIDPVHASLMKISRLFATRSPSSEKLLSLDNVWLIPDLAYSLAPTLERAPKKPFGTLIVPNIEVVPSWSDHHWVHVAWEHYKNEMSQFLDQLIDDGITPSFLTSCDNPTCSDTWAAHEIMARMKRRANNIAIFSSSCSTEDLLSLVSKHRAVITQRYHGTIIADIVGVPYVSIHHHDKIKQVISNRGTLLDYHSFSKDDLNFAHTAMLNASIEPANVDREIFDCLADEIVGIASKKAG